MLHATAFACSSTTSPPLYNALRRLMVIFMEVRKYLLSDESKTRQRTGTCSPEARRKKAQLKVARGLISTKYQRGGSTPCARICSWMHQVARLRVHPIGISVHGPAPLSLLMPPGRCCNVTCVPALMIYRRRGHAHTACLADHPSYSRQRARGTHCRGSVTRARASVVRLGLGIVGWMDG